MVGLRCSVSRADILGIGILFDYDYLVKVFTKYLAANRPDIPPPMTMALLSDSIFIYIYHTVVMEFKTCSVCIIIYNKPSFQQLLSLT